MGTHQLSLNNNSPMHQMNTSRAEDAFLLLEEQDAKSEDALA